MKILHYISSQITYRLAWRYLLYLRGKGKKVIFKSTPWKYCRIYYVDYP